MRWTASQLFLGVGIGLMACNGVLVHMNPQLLERERAVFFSKGYTVDEAARILHLVFMSPFYTGVGLLLCAVISYLYSKHASRLVSKR
jgi:hypothetical protein